MAHVALLGDSIFDNKAYVGSEPDVVGHLRRLKPNWSFDLHAVDGNMARHVSDQLASLGDEIDFLVVSAGGNNAIDNADILQMPATSSAEVLSSLADRANAFRREYSRVLDEVEATGIPHAVCTIYYPNFNEDAVQKVACAALATFNDVILSAAVERRLPVIDLRHTCNDKADYANEIEPSGQGGAKIATAIIAMAERRISGESGCVIYS